MNLNGLPTTFDFALLATVGISCQFGTVRLVGASNSRLGGALQLNSFPPRFYFAFLLSSMLFPMFLFLTDFSGILKVRAEAAALNFEKAALTRETTDTPEAYKCGFRRASAMEPPSRPREPARLVWRMSSQVK